MRASRVLQRVIGQGAMMPCRSLSVRLVVGMLAMRKEPIQWVQELGLEQQIARQLLMDDSEFMALMACAWWMLPSFLVLCTGTRISQPCWSGSGLAHSLRRTTTAGSPPRRQTGRSVQRQVERSMAK